MLFSVVIPTYNRANYIGRTIASLLQQDAAGIEYEIIVVDDGSTDNTEEVVTAVNDARVQYVRKSNAERAAARNYGARRAKGAYINFFDSDDLAYANHLRTAAASIKLLSDPEVFALAYDIQDAHGRVQRRFDALPATINATLIDGNHVGGCNGVFVRADISKQYPFNEARELSASEDYELWLRLAARFDFHCVNTVTSALVNHDDRSVLHVREDKLLLRINTLQQSLTADEAFCKAYSRQLATFQAYLHIYMALHLGIAGAPRANAFRYLVRAIVAKPGVTFTRRFAAALKNIIV
jgi:glycosyltransferase involved in cell wall biosynthesis